MVEGFTAAGDNAAAISDKSAVMSDNRAIKSDNRAIKSDNRAIKSDNGAQKSDNRAVKSLDEREAVIYQFIEKNGSVTNSEACTLLDLKAPTVRRIFKSMINKSIIEPIGNYRGRKYILTK